MNARSGSSIKNRAVNTMATMRTMLTANQRSILISIKIGKESTESHAPSGLGTRVYEKNGRSDQQLTFRPQVMTGGSAPFTPAGGRAGGCTDKDLVFGNGAGSEVLGAAEGDASARLVVTDFTPSDARSCCPCDLTMDFGNCCTSVVKD